jgi:hypothetical protein
MSVRNMHGGNAHDDNCPDCRAIKAKETDGNQAATEVSVATSASASAKETPSQFGQSAQTPPATVENAKAKLRQVFNRERSASYPPAQKRVAEEAAMEALIAAVRQEFSDKIAGRD